MICYWLEESRWILVPIGKIVVMHKLCNLLTQCITWLGPLKKITVKVLEEPHFL
jgi:hypothetical protein